MGGGRVCWKGVRIATVCVMVSYTPTPSTVALPVPHGWHLAVCAMPAASTACPVSTHTAGPAGLKSWSPKGLETFGVLSL